MYLEIALQKTFGNEGVYSKYPDDPGKETIIGVSRRWNPHLDLWKLVDQWDKVGNPPEALVKLVTNFYRGKIWEPFKLEEIADVCPELAYAVFDTTVHLWVDQSIPFLQQTLNYINKSRLKPLVVDGWIGEKTLAVLEEVRFRPKLLVNIYGIIRGSWYLDESSWDGTKPGFINRINFIGEDIP